MEKNVSEVMASGVVTAGPEETVAELRERMTSVDIGAVPVVDANGVLVGIVTGEDLLPDYPGALPLRRIMSSPVSTLGPGASCAAAARLMRAERRHHVVIIDGPRVVGMLSSLDLLKLIEG